MAAGLPLVQAEFLRHAEVIKGFLFALLPDANATEDIFQETFLVATQKASDFIPGTDFPAWVRAIARNKVRQYVERHRREAAALGAAATEAVAAAAGMLEQDWTAHRQSLEACLARLAPGARRLLEMRYAERLPPGRIGDQLRRSVGAVSVSLAKTRRFLRECVWRHMRFREALS